MSGGVKRRVLPLLCAGALCFTLAGCDHDGSYDDVPALGGSANSYSAVSFVQTTVNGVRSGSVGKLSGTYELWNCRSQGGEQAALTYTFEVTNGKAKLVFADPEGNVETLVECSTGDGPIQGTVTLDLPEGKSRIKLAGAEDAAASWTLEIDRGTWSDS